MKSRERLKIRLSCLNLLEVINIFSYYIFNNLVIISLIYLVTILEFFFHFRSKGKLVFIFLLLGLFKLKWCCTYFKENL